MTHNDKKEWEGIVGGKDINNDWMMIKVKILFIHYNFSPENT